MTDARLSVKIYDSRSGNAALYNQKRGDRRMKTYQIKMSRSRWFSLLLAVLMIVMIACLLAFSMKKKKN